MKKITFILICMLCCSCIKEQVLKPTAGNELIGVWMYEGAAPIMPLVIHDTTGQGSPENYTDVKNDKGRFLIISVDDAKTTYQIASVTSTELVLLNDRQQTLSYKKVKEW